jgi:hypothetical protein
MLELCKGQVRPGQWRKTSQKYNSHLVGVQEVKWAGGGTEPADEYTFSVEGE